MAYEDSFTDTIQQFGGTIDSSVLPGPNDIYETVVRFCEWYDQLGDADRGAYSIAWACGMTADIFDQVVDADKWLLDSVDQILDLEDAVNTARAAITAAGENEG